jgi:hypothetical protein
VPATPPIDEPLTPRKGRVVQTVPTTRAIAIAATLLALPSLALVLIFARNRPDAILTSVVTAVVVGGGMIIFHATMDTPSPLAIRPDELPQTANRLEAVVRGTVFLAFIYAFTVAFSLDQHIYITVGIALSTPIMTWDSVRQAKRTERELGGTLWAPTKIAWTRKGRYWFLVTETEPADAVVSWD